MDAHVVGHQASRATQLRISQKQVGASSAWPNVRPHPARVDRSSAGDQSPRTAKAISQVLAPDDGRARGRSAVNRATEGTYIGKIRGLSLRARPPGGHPTRARRGSHTPPLPSARPSQCRSPIQCSSVSAAGADPKVQSVNCLGVSKISVIGSRR